MISKSEYVDINSYWSFWRSANNIPVVCKLQWCINTVFMDVCTAYFAKLETNASSVSQQWWQRQEGDQNPPDRLLSFLPPAPSGISFLPGVCMCVCTSVMSIRLFVFLHVCMGFHVDVNLHVCMCVVCFNASATCGNLKLWGWNRLLCWGLFSVVPSFSAFFPLQLLTALINWAD